MERLEHRDLEDRKDLQVQWDQQELPVQLAQQVHKAPRVLMVLLDLKDQLVQRGRKVLQGLMAYQVRRDLLD